MAVITVANTDFAILAAVKTALTDAAIGSYAVFKAVYLTSGPVTFVKVQTQESPTAVVEYLTTTDDVGVCDSDSAWERNCVLSAQILIAVMVEGDDGLDECDRVQEALRLKNAAINAVEAAAPANATFVADDNFFAEKIKWGEPEIDLESNKPWAIVTLPVEFGYRLTKPTAH